MASIVVELEGQEAELPAGVEFLHYLYALYDAAGNLVSTVEDPAPSVVLQNVEPGSYVVRATAYAKSGQALGDTVVGEVTVAGEPGAETQLYFAITGMNLMVV